MERNLRPLSKDGNDYNFSFWMAGPISCEEDRATIGHSGGEGWSCSWVDPSGGGVPMILCSAAT